MPIFYHKGQRYNVDEADIKDFSSEFPNAYTVAKDKDGVTYRVAPGDWESFQQKPATPKEAYHNQPQPELEEMTKSKEERSPSNNSTDLGGLIDMEGTIAKARQTADFAGGVAGEIKAQSGNPFPPKLSATDLDAFKTPEQKAEEVPDMWGDAFREHIERSAEARYKERMKPYISTYANEEQRKRLNTTEGFNSAVSAVGSDVAHKLRDTLNEEARAFVDADEKQWTPEDAAKFRKDVIESTLRDPIAIVPESFKQKVDKKAGSKQPDEVYFAEWLNLKGKGREDYLHAETVRNLLEPSDEDAKRLNGIKERAEANTVSLSDKLRNNDSFVNWLGGSASPLAAAVVEDSYDISRQTTRALDKAEEIKEAYVNHQNDENFFLGAGKGVKDGLTDVDNWVGAYMVGDMNILTNLVGKIDRGEKLTQQEEDYMDAQAYKLAVEAAMADDLGWGYKSGNVTGVSVPFMLQMLASPVSSTTGAVANRALVGLGKRAVNKFGGTILKNLLAKTPKAITKVMSTTASKNIGKGLSRIADATTAGAAQTMLFNADRTFADAADRHLGNQAVVGRTNEQYGTNLEAQEGESWAKSIFKSAASNTSMNASEYLGSLLISPLLTRYGGHLAKPLRETLDVLKPEGLIRAAKRTGAAKAIQTLENLHRYVQGTSRLVDDLARQAEYDGLISEYLEEVADNVVNTAIGDMSVEDLLSPKQNAETILGLSWTSGAFNVLNKVTRTTSYITLSRKMKKADAVMREAAPEKWDKYVQELGKARKFDDIIGIYENFVEELSGEGNVESAASNIAEATRYTAAYAGKMGHDAVLMSEDKKGIASLLSDARENGYSLADAQMRKEAYDRMKLLEERFGSAIEPKIEEFGGPAEFLRSLEGNVSDEAFGAVVDYLLEKERYEGIKEARADDLAAKQEASRKRIDRDTHKPSGTVITASTTDPVTKKTIGVTVVNGDLSVDANTGAVTPGAGTVVIRYANGKYGMVDISTLTGFTAMNAEALKVAFDEKLSQQEQTRVQEEESGATQETTTGAEAGAAPSATPSATPSAAAPVQEAAPAAVAGNSADIAAELDKTEEGRGVKEQVDAWFAQGEEPGAVEQLLSSTAGSFAPLGMDYYNALASESAANSAPAAEPANAAVPAEGVAEASSAPTSRIMRKKGDIDAEASFENGATAQEMADAYAQEYGEEEDLPLRIAQEQLAQIQEEREKTKDLNRKHGSLRKKEKFWSEVVDLLTPKEEAVAEVANEVRQETVGTPVALQYLLEGGKGSIENAGYFFYAIQAAFPHIGAQLQEIRNSMSAEMLGMAPDAFVASNPSQLQEVRRLVEAAYGEAGTRILDQMLANSTGFYPREGKALDLEIENLRPQENAEGVSEEEASILQAGFIPEGERKLLTKDEISAIMDALEDAAVPKPNVEYTQAEWDARFKEPLDTPVGKVRMGGHQFGKLHPDGNAQHQDRRGWIGLIHETLTNPNVIVEQNAPEEGAERGYKYVFVKSFINSSGESVTYFASVSVKKEGMEVVITNHFKKYKDIKGILEKGKLCFSSISPSGMQTEPNQPSASATTSETGSNAGVSEGKVSESSSVEEGTQEEISENARNATQSEQNELEKAEKERIDALVPTIEDVADGMQTADEFVAGLFGNGIRITPESFRKETGLGREEQRRLVGIIAGKEKGGLTVEQAAETIVENYRAELAERGFSGDSMEMRDMVIDILSSRNPRAYAKEAAARRAEQALHREMEAFDRYTQEAFHMSAEEYIMYEESMLPKYIEQYKDFDEQEYYSNFADEQSTQNEHDTTRESAETGGSREILSEEQPSATPGEGTAGEGQQGGTLQGDVQGDAQEGLARAEAGQEVAEQPTEKESRTRFSTSTFEDAERIAREEQRRAPLRRTARAWEKILGVKVTLMERLEDVKDPVARREIEAAEKKGKKVPGWYSDTGGVFLYLPHVENENEVDKTCVHEIVSHKGLKELLGQEKFDELCRKVWGIMSPAARKEYRNYPNVHNELQAADEYIAHLSEEVELNARERSVWQKIMDFIAGLLGRKADNRSKAASIVGKETLSRKDISELVRLSYAEYLQRNGGVKEVTGKGSSVRLSSSNKSVARYDKENGTNVKGFFDYLRNGKKGTGNNFHIANAGELLGQYGIKGRFMVGDFTFSRVHTDNEDHKLGVKEWADVINNLNNPLAITSYKGLPNDFRLYTYATINGKNICVGVNVSTKDGNINLSRIISAYGRNIELLLGKEKENLLYPDIEELKRRISQGSTAHNSLLNATSTASAAKVVNNFENPTLREKKISFRVTPEQDKAYLDAVNREDMETAQRMVDEVLDKAGYTIRGEHGTTHKFTIFSNVNANVENSFGKGFYFTSDIEDAEKNYASDTGADLTNRIELLAERMEFEDGYEDMSYEERKEEATKRLNGGENLIISAAIRMENPCIFSIDPDGVYKETIFEAESVYEEETDEYSEPEGNLVDFVESLQEVLDSGEYWGINRFNAYELLYGESYTADQLKSKMDEMLDGIEDEEGNMASNEVFRAALEGMGFDGIIDNAPSHRFKGMGLSRETKHYIAFSPNQVKQADPVTYDNEGKVIPLSERANKENNDIRFRALPNERLRKLEEGETCNIERVFTQQKMFNFSSGEKIESYEDVAYIFRSLEDEAVENAFVALVKNGKPTIVHLGMGTATQSTVDQQAVIVAVERIKPDAVYLVHNHPSGNLKASRQDAILLDSMKKAYGDIVKDGIIINLRSGKYSVFNEEGSKIEEATPNAPEKVTAAKTYSFSKRVFDKDFNVEELMHVTGSDAADAYAREHGLVAALTSSQRLGERGKLSLLVISQGSKIVGNVFLNHTEVLSSNLGNISKEIAYYVSAMGGQAGILYGRFGINETRHLGGAVNRASAGSVRMLDAISMTEFGGYVSALDEGVMEETPSYGEGETRFRVTDGKPADAIRRAYDGEMRTARFLTKETMVDYLASVKALLDTIAEKTEKGITDPQNVYRAMLTLTNKNTQELAAFDYGVLPHMTKAIAGIMGKEWNGDWDAPEAATLQRYAKVKHGIERDRDMAVRRAIPRMAEQKCREQFSALDRMIAAESNADARDALRTKKATMLADPNGYGMQTADEIAEQMEQQWYDRIAEIRRGEGTWREKQQRMDAAIADVFGLDAEGLETYGLTLTEDYSGMTETLIAEGEIDRKTARKVSGAVRAAAYDFVEQYEERTGADKTDALWDGVRAVSAYSLEKQRSTGLVDAKYVEDCNRRYEFYVPLRNFAETTADEVYDYLDETYNDNNPVKTARGRRSEAGNPFSNVMMLGYQSITAGNKNAAVQHFWNLANRSDVKGFLVPSRTWHLAKLDDAQREEVNEKLGGIADTTGDVILPRIPENATAQQVQDIISDFEDVMKDLKKRGLAFQGKKRARQEYRLTSKQQENAHRVKVYVNGEARYVTIVGDPRAALALNGKLNPESGVPEKYKAMQQFLSGAFTSQNPSFALANIIRDTQHANMRAFITESGKYWAKFSAKQAAMMKPGRLAFLLAKYENSMGNTGRHGWGGELDMRNETHRNFKRFMELGGATGYTFSHKEIENLKKLADMAERAENKTPKGQGYVVGEIFDAIRLCSESAELINRFAAFEASLEAGRSEQRAISDAQEITLNFSRKGAGKKTYNANRNLKGKTWLESRKYNAVNAIAWLSQFGRDHLIFWNAAVQGSYQTYKMIREHPAKTTFALGGVPIALSAFALPALNAVICAFMGDDEDAYYDELPDYVRQRNLCIKNPLGRGWLKIPLDPATQKVWAAGDAIGAAWRGKRQIDYWGDLGANAVGLFSPVDIYWGDRNDNLSERALSAATSFTPTLIQPLLHSYANRDWKGKPLYNDSRYIDQLPSYAKSFKSDKESLKALSKFLNDVGNSDADSYGRTWHDFATPGVMEELLYGYTGGYGQLALAAVEGAIAIVSDDAKGNFRWDNMPVVNRLWVEGDPGQTRLNIYRNYRDTAVDFMENVEQRRSQINREYNEAKRSQDTLAQAEALAKMKQLHDGDYQRYEILNNSDKLFQKYMKGSRIEDVPDFVIKGMLEAIEIVNNPDGEKEEKKSENDK